MRDLVDLTGFIFLALDPDVDQTLREDAAGGEIVVVGAERVESLEEGGGKTVDLRLLLVGERVEVF